jgi:hypothetical protein
MQHWYAYHSDVTMKHTYASLCVSQMYVTSLKPSLFLGDVIWVVESDESKPAKKFRLADCFRVTKTLRPPFPAGYGKFVLKLEGVPLPFASPLQLCKGDPWFEILHRKYITKQKFFNKLDSEPVVVNGFLLASRVAL